MIDLLLTQINKTYDMLELQYLFNEREYLAKFNDGVIFAYAEIGKYIDYLETQYVYTLRDYRNILVGIIGVKGIDKNGRGTLCLYIGQNYRELGAGKEALLKCLNRSFRDIKNLNSIQIYSSVENVGMQKLASRYFKCCGYLPAWFKVRCRFIDAWMFTLTRKRWEEKYEIWIKEWMSDGN